MEDQELRSTLSAFVPRTLWPLLAGERANLRLEGGALFADVAGFTPLTESLARIGKEGAEELTRILNDFFTALVTVVHGEGGDVLRFGGDAMTVFFPAGADAALRAALKMQAAARAFESIPTRAGTFSLGMKIGISSGTLLLGTVGDGEVGRDYFAAGRCLDLSAEAEHHAARGEIALCPRCALRLPEAAAGVELRADGFAVLTDPSGASLGEAMAARTGELPPEPSLEALCRFLPAFISEKARSSHGVLLAEHRRTTVLFLSFAGIDYDGDETAPEKVRSVYGEIAREAGRFGGWVNKLDMGDKGSKAIVLFGAPKALEHQEERACRAALAILENAHLRSSLSDLRIGITVAPLFAAYVGSEERREYTVMGDGINMAARLMANAHPWRVLSSREVMEQASGTLAFRELDPIFVKGKTEKVAIFRPEGEREEASEERSRFVGRAEILAGVLPALTSAGDAVGLALSGEAGVGKSALIKRLGHALDEAGVRRIYVPLVAHSVHSHLSAWRPVLFSCLGVSRSAPPHIREGALRLAMAQEDEAYLPLFNALLELDLPEGEATQALSAKDRKDVLFAMLTRLVLGQVQGGPYGLCFDPLDYADPASLELLTAILAEAGDRPLKLVVAHRSAASDSLKGVVGALREIQVAPFSAEETAEYLVQIGGTAFPSDMVTDFLHRKTGGNPKFLEQILAAMRRDGLMAPGPSGLLEVDEDRLASASFPDTLEGLLLARVDALPEAERTLLKAASVLGPSFSLNLLQTLLDQPQGPLVEAILSLEQRGIIRMDTWGARPYATFADTLLRDALYESLNFSVKRAFHLKVAELLEAEGRDEPRLWPALARHYEAAESAAKASHYLWNAAEEARARFDNTTAFGFLARFVALGERTGADPKHDTQFRRGLLYLAEASKELGRLEETDQICGRIVDEVDTPTSEMVSALGKLADNMRRRGDLEGALSLYSKAAEIADRLGDKRDQMVTLSDSGVPLAMMGRFDEAMERFEGAEKLARKLGAHSSLVYALMNQGLCFQYGGRRLSSAIVKFRKAKRAANSHSLRPNQMTVSLNLAQALFDLGDYAAAYKVTSEAEGIARQFGYRQLHVVLMSNAGLYAAMLGRWVDAGRLVEKALSAARHYNMIQSVAENLQTMGFLMEAEGDFADALEQQRKGREEYERAGVREGSLGCLAAMLGLLNSLRVAAEFSRGVVGDKLGSLLDDTNLSTAHRLGLRAQGAFHEWFVGAQRREIATSQLRDLLAIAREAGQPLAIAEIGHALMELLQDCQLYDEARAVGAEIYPQIQRAYSPLRTAPALLSYARALTRLDRIEEIDGVMRELRRYSRAMDRGIQGIRFHSLKAWQAERDGRRRSASSSRAFTRTLAQRILNAQRDPSLRDAFRSLPEVQSLLTAPQR